MHDAIHIQVPSWLFLVALAATLIVIAGLIACLPHHTAPGPQRQPRTGVRPPVDYGSLSRRHATRGTDTYNGEGRRIIDPSGGIGHVDEVA